MGFEAKRVWITGASSGIGAALARAFGGAGARVILSGRDREALARVAAGVPDARILPFEVTDHAALPGIVAEAGPVDMLILNAGISQRGLAEDTVMDVYRTIMEVDYFAPVALAKLVLPQMLERGSGHLAVTASVAGKFGSPQRTGYCGAKHAVMGFFDALRTEVEFRGVKVTTIVPGFVRTEIAARALTADGSAKGEGQDDVNGGISAGEAAEIILAGFEKGLREIDVGAAGGPEMALLQLKRQDPERLFDLMGQMGEGVVRQFKG
ncbi:SDR family NAD(P)-dependent oxidoreductase [Sandaracinobacter sp. RS1-74]|uniref:SDR family NAD(P)-dependent oxidoreductase n=1 Tax=Sandaracinobacteroides sayramensis TaxID=2913411 RepID=UPI001EDACB2D|nr:SDR family NAD(P)-dependent oxidoreductase [Sandaracinobacteroides sayramensis]MCG2841022.1 SDR family NAD(P)-dependent oxidoreductase [Sandaracinobacteroides sayramensis]